MVLSRAPPIRLHGSFDEHPEYRLLAMTKIFKHETTHQVIELPEVEPNLFELLGSHVELSIMNTSGWWVCEQDPGYRGMPPSIGDDA